MSGSDARPIITIVDDDLSVRRALSRALRAAGYDVQIFASADEFLSSGPAARTVCLVLDIHFGLPEMTGLELQERLAADHAAIPTVFITAHDDAATRERVSRAGAAAYLLKPFEKTALLAAIRRALGTRGGRGEAARGQLHEPTGDGDH